MAAASPLESLLRRDRLIVIAALSAVIVACWAYILAGAGTGMSAFEMTALTRAQIEAFVRDRAGSAPRSPGRKGTLVPSLGGPA